MSKPKSDPKLSHHKATGQFYVRVNGTCLYLGTDRKTAEMERLRILLEWHRTGCAFTETPPQQEITVAEIFARWTVHAREHYRSNPVYLDNQLAVFRDFLEIHADLPAATFGPLKLKAWRKSLCNGRASRSTVNRKARAVVLVFKWAVSEELVPPSVYEALKTVDGLKAGRAAGVVESRPVQDVPWESVEMTLPFLTGPVADMVRLLWFCGARVGEVVKLKACDIDTSGPIWTATLKHHKNAHRGKERVLCFGKECQAILRPLMLAAPVGLPLFSPKASIAIKAATAPTHRREGQKPTPRATDRTLNDSYENHAINRAVRRGVDALNAERRAGGLDPIEPWHVHQLRHSFATRTRAAMGLEAASVALGHSDLEVTKIYATADRALAFKVAELMG